jgi:hypothetical protein
LERKKSTGDAMRAKIGPTTWATLLTMWWDPYQASCIILMQSWTSQTWFDLKPSIYTFLLEILRGGGRKHKIHNKDLQAVTIGGETLPVALQLYQHLLLQQHDKEGVVEPLDMGIVELLVLNSLSCFIY